MSGSHYAGQIGMVRRTLNELEYTGRPALARDLADEIRAIVGRGADRGPTRITPKDVLVFRGVAVEQTLERAEELKAQTGCSLVIVLTPDAPLDAVTSLDEEQMRTLGWVKATPEATS